MTADGVLRVTTPSGVTRVSRPPGMHPACSTALRVTAEREPLLGVDPPPF
jgi:hypothetical protein